MVELNPKQEVWFTVDMAADVLDRSPATVRNRCTMGQFPNAVKEKNAWRIPQSDLAYLLEKPPEDLLLITEASESTGLTRSWINKLCLSKAIPATFWHGRWYIRREDLESYIETSKDLYDVRYDILRDPEKLWECYARNSHSFVQAAVECKCGKSTFRDYFYKAGLTRKSRRHQHDNGNAEPEPRGVYARMDIVPDQCPRDCPGWEADKDCLTEGMDCIFG